MSLDMLGMLFGTDKTRLRNDYLRHYQRLFEPWRDREFTLFEIGIHNGASLLTWAAYFTRATIVGIDIEPACKRFASGRILVEIGSQMDGPFLANLAAKHAPTHVIDDGSHLSEHQIYSFETLFPVLQPGGCYVVEDMSHSKTQGGGQSALDYFSQLQRLTLDQASWSAERQVDRIDTIPHAMAVWKPEKEDYSSSLPIIFDVVERSQNPDSYLYLSEYLDRSAGDLDRATEVAQKGISLAPHEPWFYVRLADILQKRGDLREAFEQANKAFELRPDILFMREYKSRIAKKLT